ncbi:hypothetical protein [Kosmotoga arenicorallina]|uniref:hypothetical protein n=1 Tax=Kosmotoga arenicorallina TaxID=688066 RepID=UPI000AD64E89|nr:hypothetical protein [Kosmotoga arenicorallina]
MMERLLVMRSLQEKHEKPRAESRCAATDDSTTVGGTTIDGTTLAEADKWWNDG